MNNKQQKAADILKNGGIVIFPTDTAFGIGCRIDDEKAVKRLFEIRKRPETKATPVLVSSLEMAQRYLDPIPWDVKEKLIDKYWPGACTIILDRNKVYVPRLVSGGGTTLGVRMPDHQVILEIIKQVGVPIIGTSANFAGESTPYRPEDLNPELVKLVDFVLQTASHPRLDRGSMDSRLHGNDNVSTVVDCSVKPWVVLREGKKRLPLD